MNILVVNAGSSSLKYQFFDLDGNEILIQGNIERIGEGGKSPIYHEFSDGKEVKLETHVDDHGVAIKIVIAALKHYSKNGYPKLGTIDGVGYRVVHGGTFYSESALVTPETISNIRLVAPMAPLHNYAVSDVMEICSEILPDAVHVAVFDTAFHATIPSVAHRYSLPKDIVDRFGIRKFGFHGTSHRYVSQATNEFLGKVPEYLVSLHIGNGASLCAIKNGISVDTTMGFTPLGGIMMGTRSGDIDPAIVTYIIENSEYSSNEVDRILNRQSGLLGASGVSNDFRLIQERAEKGDKDCKEAIDMYVYSIVRNIGAMAFGMGGLDVLAFTAGVGQNSSYLRQLVVDSLSGFGVKLDPEKNERHSKEVRLVSSDDSKVDVLVVPTNEELMIAKDVVSFFDTEQQ